MARSFQWLGHNKCVFHQFTMCWYVYAEVERCRRSNLRFKHTSVFKTQVGSAAALDLSVYVPAHCELMEDAFVMTEPLEAASHVKVIGGAGPEAVTVAPPVQEPEQTTGVIVELTVMDVGCVILNVCVRKQFKLSRMFTVA